MTGTSALMDLVLTLHIAVAWGLGVPLFFRWLDKRYK